MKWDLDSHTSSRSLTHPAGNLNNKPAARNDHTTQPETESALNRFALKPLVLRWDLLRPVIGKVLAPYVPDPVQVLGREGTALVDGTVCPVWDWDAIPDLYSGKAKYTGMNVQIACNLKGGVAAIGPVPVHGARHDAHAFEASRLKEILQKSMTAGNTGADLGYIGVDGIGIVPFKRLSGAELLDWQRDFNTIFSKIRAAVEHAVAKVKTWRMLSREGGRYRCPIGKFESMLAAVTGLFFFAEYSND